MIKALDSLNFKSKFVNPIEKLPSQMKQEQLEEIILKYARIASKNRDDFEELIRGTCFELAIQTKVGLKLYPDNPNPKASIRIKEKMLFKKNAEVKKQMKGTIKETLESEG